MPPSQRNLIYAFDRTFEMALAALAAPLVGVIAERFFGFTVSHSVVSVLALLLLHHAAHCILAVARMSCGIQGICLSPASASTYDVSESPRLPCRALPLRQADLQRTSGTT